MDSIDFGLEFERDGAMSLVLTEGQQPIAGYTLVRLLGRGGFGEVWEASAPGDFHVALKFLRLGTKESSVEQRSLEVIRHIRHPHLLDVQFATRVADCLVIAMPLCDRSLMDRFRECPAGLPRDELLGYMADLARAVDFLNEPNHPAGDGSKVGVQHRDIKPHNIFLVGGVVRLADFGLAKILVGNHVSHTGMMSVPYVAPEVFDHRVSSRSDQYSLAVTYCQLRTGRLPFERESEAQFMYAHLHVPPNLSRLPEAERLAVARALAKSPDERWPNCRAFVAALGASVPEAGHLPAGGDDPGGMGPGTAIEPGIGPSVVTPTKISEDFELLGAASGSIERAGATPAKPPVPPAEPWPWKMVLAVVLGSCGLAFVIYAINGNGSLASRRPEPEQVQRHPAKPPELTPAPAIPSSPARSKVVKEDVERSASPPPKRSELPQEITNTLGMKLVLIPAGSFEMGSPETDSDAEDVEKPQHSVRITSPFYLGVTEVTVGQFRKFIEATGYETQAEKDGQGSWGWNEVKSQFERDLRYTWRNPGFPQSDEHPVVNVSWNDAVKFCEYLNTLSREQQTDPLEAGVYRLPTEAEWEYACRAGTITRFECGDDAEQLAQVGNVADGTARLKFPEWNPITAEDGYIFTAPVARFRANRFGLHDMHGNVWEWCWDGFDKSFYGQSPPDDPGRAQDVETRVIRGGGWELAPRTCRSANRSGQARGYWSYSLGFRVARGQLRP
jgi:formylglycine-generating enzyme required for sulfatase activity